MSHMIELTDEQYAAIEAAAREQGVTPAVYLAMVAKAGSKEAVIYDDLDDFFRSLGASEEEIVRSKQEVDTHFPPDDGSSSDVNQ